MRQRIGWWLMGYPMLIGYKRWIFQPPFWKQIYRLGARLHDSTDN